MAAATARDNDAISARLRQIEALGENGRYPSAAFIAAVARGFTAFENGDHAGTIEALTPLIAQNERVGGSRAQLDLLTFTLLKSCLSAGRLDDARRIIQARRPGAVPVPVAGVERVH